MGRKNSLVITEGRMWDKILLFALPLAASGILQQLFNAADVAVIGQFAGYNALAAVGANSQISNLLINLFVGLSIGANVVISNYLGEKNREKTSDAVHTSILLSLIGGAILALIGIAFARPLLTVTSTPDEILDDAVLYLRVYFAGMPFVMLYNFSASIFRSCGDTRRPLIVLMAAGLLNVLLNLFFVLAFHMTVEGVALATVLSNVFSSLVLVYLLTREQSDIHLDLRKLHITGSIFKRIAAIGIPAGLQSITFSFSNVLVQSSVNSLGPLTIAGNTTGHNFDAFTYYVLNAFSQAAVTFVGQNRGAGLSQRCRTAGRLCTGIGMLATAMFSAVEVIFRHPLVSLFTPDPAVQEIAAQRVLVCMSFQFINACVDQLSGCMRGMGESLKPAIICIASICGIRILWIFFVFPLNPVYPWLMTVYPISWAVTVIPLFLSYRKSIRDFCRTAEAKAAV